MKTIKIKDKEFLLSISESEINKAVDRLAKQLNKDLVGKNPLFIVILNGAFMFAADLFKQLTIPCEVSFVKLSSYAGTNNKEEVKTILGLAEDVKGRTVVIVEDIVDTGNTIENIKGKVMKLFPDEVKICTLLFKPGAYRKDFKIDYTGIEIQNDFIVGYGLDYDGYGRNLKDIYKLIIQ